MLWSHLGNTSHIETPQTSSTDKRASILFCLLHELLPNSLCEEIIINNFLSAQNISHLIQKVDSFKRFTRLWHWSRELNSSSDLQNEENYLNNEELSISTIKYGKLTKTFERCLLILLDMLGKDDTPRSLSKLIQEWLISCITDYNDLARLMDILLVSLLHPSTARVSVQYFINNLLNSTSTGTSTKSLGFYLNEDEADFMDSTLNYESKVYAISNEGGNVKYHVNEATSNKSQTQPNQQLFLLTSLDQSTQSMNSTSLNQTKPFRNANVELPLSILNAASFANQGSGISLRINPFLSSKNTANHDQDDLEDSEHDQVDNNNKNARLLENYRIIKAGQLKEREINGNKKQETKTSPNMSPSLSPSLGSSFSPKGLDQPPVVHVDKSNRLSLETNQSEDMTVDLDDELDEEDDENEDLDEDQDENDYEGFNLNSDEDYDEDSQSQTTDITLLSSTMPQHHQLDKSPSLIKKLRNSLNQKSPKLKLKKEKKNHRRVKTIQHQR